MNIFKTFDQSNKEDKTDLMEHQDDITKKVNDEPKDEEQEMEQKVDDKLISISQFNEAYTQFTGLTGKTYISELQKKLDEEKLARENL